MWNEGYVSEIGYIHGYFGELAPARLRLALLSKGIAHAISDVPNYLELGFGQGLSLAINAATSSGHFYGTDFNPAQTANAAGLAAASGKAMHVYDDSFEDFAKRSDLPSFDIIALHGIWSWVSDSARRAIVDIARHHLKPGGIMYISYNTAPGWSSTGPLRNLLAEYARRSAMGGLLDRVQQSLVFAERLVDANAGYFQANPSAVERLNLIKTQDKNYVTHEYFNRHWQPMSFLEVSDALTEAKLDYAASANILDNIEAISVPASAVEILGTIADPALREMTRDYFVNQQFRRDIFIKGVRHLGRTEMMQHIEQQKFIVIGDLTEPPKKVRAAAGEAELRPDIYDPIIAHIVADPDRFCSVSTIKADVACKALNPWQIWEALLVLVGANFIAPSHASDTPAADLDAAYRLNLEICRRAAFSGDMQYLAAPRIGSAISSPRIEQLFLLGLATGAENLAEFAQTCLDLQGESLLVDGEAIRDPVRSKGLLIEMLARFDLVKLPMLRRMGVVSDPPR